MGLEVIAKSMLAAGVRVWGTNGRIVDPAEPVSTIRSLYHIGDSLSSDDEAITSGARAFIAGKYNAQATLTVSPDDIYGVWGKEINKADSRGNTTVKNIKDRRAAGAEPDLWVIALCTNMVSDGEQQNSLDFSAETAQMDAVLAELGVGARVLAVGMATAYSRGNAFHKGVNAEWAKRMAARGAKGSFFDYLAVAAADTTFDWEANGTMFRDGTHMTQAGYDHKYTRLAAFAASVA